MTLEDEILFQRYGIKGYSDKITPEKGSNQGLNDDESPCMLKKKVISL